MNKSKDYVLRVFTAALSVLAIMSFTKQAVSEVLKADWGEVNGKAVYLYTLTNKNGLVAKVTNYGTIITELHVPDRDGKMADIVLGFDNLDGYLAGHPYFGCTAGRVANRIANGKFTLGEVEYTLATNNGPNHLHGGEKGFDKKVWDVTNATKTR